MTLSTAAYTLDTQESLASDHIKLLTSSSRTYIPAAVLQKATDDDALPVDGLAMTTIPYGHIGSMGGVSSLDIMPRLTLARSLTALWRVFPDERYSDSVGDCHCMIRQKLSPSRCPLSDRQIFPETVVEIAVVILPSLLVLFPRLGR